MSTPAMQDDSARFLKRASFWVIVENVVKVLEPLFVMACLKVFGGGEWGAFKVHEAIVLIGMRTICLGLERGLIWYQAQCDEKRHMRAYWQSLSFMGTLAIILAGGIAGLSALGVSILPTPETYGYSQSALVLYGVAMLIQALMYPSSQFLVSRQVLHVNMLSRYVALPLGVYGSALFLRYLGVGTIALPTAYLIGSSLSFLVAFGSVLYYVPGILKAFTLNPVPPLKLLKFSVIISSSEIAMALAARLDIYLLTMHFGLRSVEIYTTILMLVNSMRTIRMSFDNILLGLFSRLAKKPNPLDSLVKAYQQANAKVFRLQLPIMVVMIAFGELLMGWLLPSAADVLFPLALGLSLVFLATPFSFCIQWQVGSGRSWLMPVGQGVFMAVNAGLNLLLIPRFGVLGGVAASGLAQVLGGSPAWIACLRQVGFNMYFRDFWKPLLPLLLWPSWLLLHFLMQSWVLDILILSCTVIFWVYFQNREKTDHV